MSQAGYTPIQLYYSTTAAAVPVNTNLADGELAINITDGKLYFKNAGGTVTLLASTAGAAGDVVGPASSTDNALARFDLATGKLIQNSVGILSDAGILTGLTGLTSSGSITLSSLTSGRITYAGTAGLLQDSANLTFNGTTLVANDLTDSSLTAGRVTYAGTAGNLVDSANMTFNGTILTAAGFSGPLNGTVGATTANTGAFTTLSATGATTLLAQLTASTGDGSYPIISKDTSAFSVGVTGSKIGFFGLDSTSTNTALGAISTLAQASQNATLRVQVLNSGSLATIGTFSTTGLAVTGALSATTTLGVTGATTLSSTLTVVNNVTIRDDTLNTPRILTFSANATSAGNYGTIRFGNTQNLNNNASIVGSVDVNIDDGKLTFSTAPTGGALTERFRFGSLGQFGIGGATYGTAGQVLTSGGPSAPPTWAAGGGGGSQWTTSGSNIYYTTGKVGIGTTAPNGTLQIGSGNGGGNVPTTSALQFGANNSVVTFLGANDSDSIDGVIGSWNTVYNHQNAKIEFFKSANTGSLRFYTQEGTGITERMRIDSAGRVGIGTTAATTNIARLQVTHNAETDRYGIYVPGGVYTGSGPSGTQYGGYFSNHTTNSASGVVGVAGVISNIGAASSVFGGYFDGGAAAQNQPTGVYGTARQSDFNGPAQARGGWFNANSTGSSSGGTGSTVAVYAQNTATISFTYGVYVTTVSTSGTATGIYYEHQGGLQFKVKSNGGIDNYSGNNTNLSDRREKKDFAPAKSYLETICSIPVQTFKFIDQQDDLPNLGVVAQDVQAVAPELVLESNWARHDEEPKMRLSVYETDLVYALMKSIQELKTIVDAQSAEIAALKGAA